MPTETLYSNLNDRIAQQAAAMCAPKPERQSPPRPPAKPAPAPAASPASGIRHPASGIQSLALTPQDWADMVAQGTVTADACPFPLPVAKDGVDLAHLQGVRVQFMLVTPAQAKAWLKHNFGNRPVSDDVVDAYARDMKSGTFLTTHQGVAFNDRDDLIDGQHRLLAIVKSGVSVPMMVTFGLPSAIPGRKMTTMDAVDRGRTRSVADQLKIQHGLKDGSLIAMVTRGVASICSSERTRRLSVGQTLEIYHGFENSMRWIIANRSKAPGFKAAGVLAAFTFAHAGDVKHRPQIQKWFVDLNKDRAAESEPLGKLHAFLSSDEARLLMSGSDRGLAELVLQTIWCQLTGRPASEVEVKPDGADHFRQLQPDRVELVAKMFRLAEPKS